MASEHQNLSKYDKNKVKTATGYRFGIVTAQWNNDITFSLRDACLETLKNNDDKLEFIPSDKKKLTDSFISLGKSDQLIGSLIKSQKGDILGPVKTYRGYGLIIVNEISNFDSTAWNNQQSIIRSELKRLEQNNLYQNWMTGLKEKAKIIDNRKFYF